MTDNEKALKNESKNSTTNSISNNNEKYKDFAKKDFIKYGLKNDAEFHKLYYSKNKKDECREQDKAFISKLMYYSNEKSDKAKEVFLKSPYYNSKSDNYKQMIETTDYIDSLITEYEENSHGLGVVIDDYSGELDKKITYNTGTFENTMKGISEALDADDYEWVVKGLFPKRFTSILFGEPGCGKTWIALDLALKLSLGEMVFGHFQATKSRVLLFEGDAPTTLLKERLKKFNCQLSDDYFKYVNRYEAEEEGIELNLSDWNDRPNFERYVSTYNPDFVIIDTLVSFSEDESDAENMRTVIDFLRYIAEKYDCHILIIHHSRKREGGTTRTTLDQSDVIGSSILIRLGSAIIGIDKLPDKDENKLAGVLALKKVWFSGAPSLSFELNETSEDKIDIAYNEYHAKKYAAERAEEKIRQYLNDCDIKEFKRKDLENALVGEELSLSALKNALIAMEAKGDIKSEGFTSNRTYTIVRNLRPSPW